MDDGTHPLRCHASLLTKIIHAKSLITNLKDAELAAKAKYIQELEMSSYNGEFVWMVIRVSEMSNVTPTERMSPNFYICKCGYKMYVKLDMTCTGRTIQMSLWLHLIDGEYDDDLPWPFKQKVTFMLLHQGGEDHTVESFIPRQNTTKDIPHSCPVFNHLEIQLDDKRYIQDDILFFKIVVDVQNVTK
ncbi:TNF receptor-associated factor 1-like [Saccoglossus kowalevskii]|uniref:TNF receptor-associated factor 1-like n=1 Tax=Saccoglossus kowalevskii TaxID=10224 RepID=A0ABM0MXA4_SACKO|nr:PREDICTED: TNF receptor-associated factor 1-like [Saccoglossus kowalevskii]